jgi:predicted nucleic acid-binding protein
VIILDTNVVSALMRSRPQAAVVGWLDDQPADSIWITAITLFEARFGLALLPAGKRRRGLETAFEAFLGEELQNRIIDFDSAAAARAADLAAHRHRRGQPVDIRDTLIAGIALARRAVLATRNIRHFADLDVPVVDPWAAGLR